jgi:hypothetical protein
MTLVYSIQFNNQQHTQVSFYSELWIHSDSLMKHRQKKESLTHYITYKDGRSLEQIITVLHAN